MGMFKFGGGAGSPASSKAGGAMGKMSLSGLMSKARENAPSKPSQGPQAKLAQAKASQRQMGQGIGPLKSLANKTPDDGMSPMGRAYSDMYQNLGPLLEQKGFDPGTFDKRPLGGPEGWQGVPFKLPEDTPMSGLNFGRGSSPGQSGNKGWQQGDVTSGGVPARKAPLAADSGHIMGQYVAPREPTMTPLMQLLSQFSPQAPIPTSGMRQPFRF